MTAAALAAAFRRRYGVAPPPGYHVAIEKDPTIGFEWMLYHGDRGVRSGWTITKHTVAAAKREAVEALRLLTVERAA